ncbi:MAG TPA: ribonuclease R [Gammaproteobacteria bacterium]|nr:ribonuclease R [Gammaproteobacteria bacterium]
MPRDPRDAERSERRYEHQIPSRDEISVAMERAGHPLTLEALAPRFDINTEQHRRALEARLKAMVRDGQLIRNRAREYCLTRHLDVVTGTVLAHRDGFGFLRPDDGSPDVYLSARAMSELWDGDRIAVRTNDTPRGKEGHVAEILARGKAHVVGLFRRERGIDSVIEEGDSRTEVLIARGESGEAKPGDIVKVEVLEHPTKRSHAVGRVVQIVGRHDQPSIETDVAMLAHGIPYEWPLDALAEARSFPKDVPANAKEGREDLRSLPLVTIDGADARDFDDAVFAEPQGDGWRLIVAIADVAHYVQPDTPLDREARSRGTSVYFPDRVVPMLPEELSNGLCSLNPHVDRLSLACEMSVSPRGEVTRSRFFDCVFRSAARLTYPEAAEILESPRPKSPSGHLKPALMPLLDVYRALDKARRSRGAIDFDLPETKIVLNDQGKVGSVRAAERLVTHKLIEECMIAANVEAAKRMRKAKIPALYRVHEAPGEDKLEELLLFLQTFGYKLSPQKITPKEINTIIERVQGKPEEELVETVVLRSMMQARYQPANVGHFGLALGAYAHFTSPIRRYPDLLVHRALKWLNKKGSTKGYRYNLEEMEKLGEHCSRTERRADDATREVAERLKCLYLKDHVGETFDGIIGGVAPFGLFVRLRELQADGLVHVTSLPKDYYHRDPTGTALTGERTRETYRLADPMRVRLVAVNIEERKVDFVPAEPEPGSGASPETRSRAAPEAGSGARRKGQAPRPSGKQRRGRRG